MRSLRTLTSLALAMSVAVGQMSVATSTASAQGWDGRHAGHGGRAGHSAPKPAPAAVQRLRTPPVVVAPPAPRYVAPPARPHFGGGHHTRPVYRHEHRPEHRGGHHYGGGRVAAGVALGVGALIVGSAIASSAHASSRSSDYERCASRYDSFDWDTGTIETENGDRVVCPYLD
jgi:hypothetical protein